MTTPTDLEVVDLPDQSRFVVRADDAEAELVYRRDGDRLILVHTLVPDALGGRGIGGQLVAAALRRAAAEGLTVVPWCPFARHFLHEHPDVAAGVTIDWATAPPPR
jgi:predicted GNAT family acetyltransferase